MKKRECGDYDDATRHNDYLRHIREGTKPCIPSKRAWANHRRILRATRGAS
jgi:hypothetical protein